MLQFNAPMLDCSDTEVLQQYSNATSDGSWQCNRDRQRRIAARAYFGVAIFNAVAILITTLLFVYCASGSSTSFTEIQSKKQWKQRRKQQSLQKRSVSATCLGAFGHLVLSTCLFLTQSFDGDIACQLVLWGTVVGFYTWMFAFCIRAYRLRFLFRLNQLKVKYLRMSSAERLSCINDKEYQWYLRNNLNRNRKMKKPYIVYVISILVIVLVTIPSELVSMKNEGACFIRWGASIMVAYYAVFIVVLVPFMLWYLRENSDAHGIRTEVWISAIVGIPFFVLYVAWFVLDAYKHVTLGFYVDRYYGPGNWVIYFTAIAHFVAVVIPVIGYIPIENRHWLRFQCRLKTFCNNTARLASCETGASEEEALSPTDIIPELSIESLESIMGDPDMMHQLLQLAIRDFSSENVLFYEKYLILEQKFRDEFIHANAIYQDSSLLVSSSSLSSPAPLLEKQNHQPIIPKNWINSIAKRSPTVPFRSIVHFTPPNASNTPDPSIQRIDIDEITSKDTSINLKRFLSTPIPYKLYPDFAKLYETFIREEAPTQVNISYRARHTIDETFAAIYKRYPELYLKKEQPYSNRHSTCLHEDNENEKSADQKVHISHISHETDVQINFYLFEPARVEVCWNIFNSVYPKLVDMYQYSPNAN